MIRLATIAAVATMVAASPALAVSYDAFSSFTGVNGTGGFSYGSTGGAVLTPFTTNGGCALFGPSTCLHSATANLPQASVGGNYPTVVVPTNALLLHPGDSNALSVYGVFTAATAGTYSYTLDLASVGRDTTDGTLLTVFTSIGGIVTPTGATGALPTFTSTATFTGTTTLVAGESFGVYVNRNTSYGGDSTSLNFSLTTVPEPASWALMIAGFGLVGVAARRRTAATA